MIDKGLLNLGIPPKPSSISLPSLPSGPPPAPGFTPSQKIVMGSHCYSGFKGMLAGSVSHKVADSATCTCIAVT